MGDTSPRRSNPGPWTIIGGPSPGTVAALAIGLNDGYTVVAGTRTGLYRTRDASATPATRWERLAAVPLEIVSLGISPQYGEDRTILAGTPNGLYISRDGGDRWQAARTPMPDSMILALCFSPNYRADGIILAGTLEDGICYSDTRGESWSYRGFGLLDATVYSLSMSPDFARDETVFAGTETALYYSYNGARAWKQLNFPEDAAPILSLALSPDFSQDQIIYAGTESHGLLRSGDLGRTWEKLNLPAMCVNALAISPEHGKLFAATDSGLYVSGDGGRNWACLLDVPNTLSMAVKDGIIIAGLADGGAWLTSDSAVWRPYFSGPARSLVGMALSPRFAADPVAFLHGPQEGIWRTADGGLSWRCLNEGLPGLDVWALAVSPRFPQDRTLVAASANGILLSEDAGDHWFLWLDTPASLVAFPPNGKFVAAGFPGGEIRVSEMLKGPWKSLPGPWEEGAKILTFAVDDQLTFRTALLDRAGKSLSIWEGQPGRFEQVLSRPAGADPIVVCWVPPLRHPGASWYASQDNEVWEFRRPAGKASVQASLILETQDGSKILALTGGQSQMGSVLFACTGQTIYKSTATRSWTAVHDFGDERAISLVLSPSYPGDPTAFALLLGGSFCRGVLQ